MLIYVSPQSEVDRIAYKYPSRKLPNGRFFLPQCDLTPPHDQDNLIEAERAQVIMLDLLATAVSQHPDSLILTSFDSAPGISVAIMLDKIPDDTLATRFTNQGVRVVTNVRDLESWLNSEFRQRDVTDETNRRIAQLIMSMNSSDDPVLRKIGVAADQLRKVIENNPKDDDVIDAKRGLLKQRLMEYYSYYSRKPLWWVNLDAL